MSDGGRKEFAEIIKLCFEEKLATVSYPQAQFIDRVRDLAEQGLRNLSSAPSALPDGLEQRVRDELARLAPVGTVLTDAQQKEVRAKIVDMVTRELTDMKFPPLVIMMIVHAMKLNPTGGQ